MFLLDKETVFSPMLLETILKEFNTKQRPKLQKYHDYYIGKHDILRKWYEDQTKPCNRIITNYPKIITNSYSGYLTGKDITYSSKKDITQIQDILNYNDVATEDNDLLTNTLIYGIGAEIMYIDSAKKVRFSTIDSREFIPIYENTLEQELLAVIRYYPVDTLTIDSGFYVELYTNSEIITFRCNSLLSGLAEINREPHYFGLVPVNVFILNKEQTSIFDEIMSLQDAYNTIVSSTIDDEEAFTDCYMVLKGLSVDEEELSLMKTNRVLVLGDNGEASYLTKDINDTAIQNILKTINENIHKVASCPDFSQENFGVSSGIALRYRLLGFENRAGAIEKNMAKCLQRRIELICNILTMVGDEVFRDVEIIFTRNLPIDSAEIINTVNGLRGLVSDRTLLAQVPFIQDIDAEIEAIQEQRTANLDLYSSAFDRNNDEA